MKQYDENPIKKPYHHGDLRNALIAAGHALLAEEGVTALELRKVARRAGVSQAAPYRHFTDKQALVAAIAEDGFRQLADQTQRALESAPDQPRQQLLAIAHGYVRFALDHPALMREMFSGLTIERAAYPALYAASKVGFAHMLGVIQRGQARAEFADADPTQLALVAWSLFHGLAMLLIEDQIPDARDNDPMVAQLVDGCMQTLYRGLARP